MRGANRRLSAVIVLSLVVAGLALGSGSGRPESDYLIYVVSESADTIARVRFGPGGAWVEKEITTGRMPVDIDGPHGLVVSPDRRYYYVSLAHGRPYGTVWKYAAENDSVVGQVTLGMFPATMDLSADGNLLYVVNFNLHGDMVASSVSVVLTEEMIEVARIPTCTMPHGSRMSVRGRHYSACMMDDMLVEIDQRRLRVARHFILTKGNERGVEGPPEHAGHRADLTCSPTWAQPSVDGARVYVACNKLATGRELARIPTRRRVVHGAVVSPDSRYAFISVEGVGSEPGTVEVIDLGSLQTVAAVDVGAQAAGIDFFRLEPEPAAAASSQ
jgi:DNA-binding beta-propeller fold protein YncE